MTDVGIEISTLIPLLLVDGDPESRKSTHLHLMEDTQLHRQRTALKTILASNPDGDKEFILLFKLAVVYFMLNKFESASGFISRAVQFCPKDVPLQKV